MTFPLKGSRTTALALLLLSCVVCVLAARDFRSLWTPDRVVPAPGFRQEMLSRYFEALKGTPLDTPVFVQEGAEPGGTLFVLGGTHPNEPAGYLTAVTLLVGILVFRRSVGGVLKEL